MANKNVANVTDSPASPNTRAHRRQQRRLTREEPRFHSGDRFWGEITRRLAHYPFGKAHLFFSSHNWVNIPMSILKGLMRIRYFRNPSRGRATGLGRIFCGEKREAESRATAEEKQHECDEESQVFRYENKIFRFKSMRRPHSHCSTNASISSSWHNRIVHWKQWSVK